MKKIYPPGIFLLFIFLAACSKDFLKKYDKRIIGTWRITDVNHFGFGGNSDEVTFRDGTFVFNEGGSLSYISSSNITYAGTWDIVKKNIGDETVRSLQITVANYTQQQVLSEYYDDMHFKGTDHFKAEIRSGFHVYTVHFRR